MIPASLPVDADLLDRLTRAARQGPSGPNLLTTEQAAQAGEYNWTSPHRLSRSAREHVQAAARQMARRIAADAKPLLRRELALSAQEPAEQYAWHLKASLTPAGGYALSLTAGDNRPCGCLVLSARLAVSMVETMLGGGQGGAARKLSPLESALLSDVMTALGRSAAAAAAQLGLGLQAATNMLELAEALPREPALECCRLGFCEGDRTEADLHLILPTELVESALQERSGLQGQALPPGQQRQAMLEHVAGTRVRVEAVVGTASARFAEVLALESGDVLVLDRRPSDGLEVRVAGKPVLRAQAVVAGEQYALKIVP